MRRALGHASFKRYDYYARFIKCFGTKSTGHLLDFDFEDDDGNDIGGFDSEDEDILPIIRNSVFDTIVRLRPTPLPSLVSLYLSEDNDRLLDYFLSPSIKLLDIEYDSLMAGGEARVARYARPSRPFSQL